MSEKQEKSALVERTPAKGKRASGPSADIGVKLKQYYDSILTEEVPDRFAQLLAQLEQAEKKSDRN